MTITGTNGPASSCAFGTDSVHSEITFPATSPPDAQARPGTSAGIELAGDQRFTYVTFDGILFGQLGGEQMIGQLGGGGDPDGHYGYCTASDPFIDTSVSGHFILFDAQTGHGINHPHVVAGYQYLPSGNAVAAATKYLAAPEGPLAGLGPGLPDQLLVNYPISQGDSITFTSLDTHPHTVTACAAPCTAFHPVVSKAFDGDIFLAGDQYTVNSTNLEPGTYHYFCEIHPFMRGEFTVLPRPRSGATGRTLRARAH